MPGVPPLGFEMRLDRASLASLSQAIPRLSGEGPRDLSIRLGGSYRGSLRGDGEASIGHATVLGVALEELHAPIELTFAPARGRGR